MLFNWKLFPGTNLQDLNLDWIINFVKMIPSRLPKFSDHHTWLVYDYSTGEYYDSGEPTGGAGVPGEPGKSPIIGANGNWWTWNTTTEAYTDTGTRAQGVQGEPGAGVAAGGVAGDVLIKASGVDYNTGWTPTPPQMGTLAQIETSPTQQAHALLDNIVYNGKLYQVVVPIGANESLTPGTNIIERKALPEVFTYSSESVAVTPGSITQLIPSTALPKGRYLILASIISDKTAQTMIQCRLTVDGGNYFKNDPVMYSGVSVQSLTVASLDFTLSTFINNVQFDGTTPYTTTTNVVGRVIAIKL